MMRTLIGGSILVAISMFTGLVEGSDEPSVFLQDPSADLFRGQYEGLGDLPEGPSELFFNGFESGTCEGWSAVEPPLIADFAVSQSGLSVALEDMSWNCPSTWEWDMGDGAVKFGSDAVHTYAEAGIYTITLTVVNPSSIAVGDLEVEVSLPARPTR